MACKRSEAGYSFASAPAQHPLCGQAEDMKASCHGPGL
ncbi:hypothetical protein DUNSADRAFT_18252 [Dunaliella salina]|uniref:Uncharacterized protein n=1 Tax=Dunaliella salina TaxID=3046 RepID=A0ABQ7G0G2_DUNSA|nr:hypothetical protein DUNSADRAFT_18252 [Dunaliella salina]|eukprot:KAF5828089.1 hypothetical protein DUNSADRAFT_18252 [Dunaliella salina]